jgi:hypothetical protein
MKACIETRHLGYAGQAIEDSLDCCQVERLVQWGQRNEFGQICQYLARQDYRLGKPHTTMNDAVPNTQHSCACPSRPQPRSQSINGGMTISHSAVQTTVCENRTVEVLHAKSR